MSRKARALLVVSGKGNNGPAPRRFVTGFQLISRLLLTRGFAASDLTTKTSISCADFKTEVAKLANDSRAGDLAVIMFGGHGDNGSIRDRREGWVFSDGQVYTDRDLASALADFGDIELVVISDCCYAAGMFTPGESFIDLRLSRLFQATLSRLSATTDFVVIASALSNESFGISKPKNPFAANMLDLVPGTRTYDELGARLYKASRRQPSHWVVKGRPQAAMDRVPFSAAAAARFSAPSTSWPPNIGHRLRRMSLTVRSWVSRALGGRLGSGR
jgi:hypothetical protein